MEKNNQSISIRIIVIGILMLIFLIPFFFISELVNERQSRKMEVLNDIYSKWADDQTLSGFILDIPYKKIIEETIFDETTKTEKKKISSQINIAHFLPEQLVIRGRIFPEIRYRGIYQAIVYHGDFDVNGYFLYPDFAKLNIPENSILPDDATLSFGVSDLRGIEKSVTVKWVNSESAADPGLLCKDILASGFSRKVRIEKQANEKINFSMKLKIRGSRSLNFIPLGKITEVELVSSWKNPSFSGKYLPQTRTVNEKGFTARWQVLHLNREFPQQWSGSEWETGKYAFGFELMTVVGDYMKIMRSTKYAVIFIGLTFLAYFLLIEILNRYRIHPMQYLMVGLALCMFYMLLLSITEHLSFNTAYAIATASIVLLTMMYAKGISKKTNLAVIMGGFILILYGYLFVLLQLEDYSLLIGTVGLSIILALLMFFTRKVQWYDIKESGKPEH